MRRIAAGAAVAFAVAFAGGAGAQQSHGPGTAAFFQRAIIRALTQDCSGRYPTLAPSLESQQGQWLERNADALATLDGLVAGLPADRKQALDDLTATTIAAARDQYRVVERAGDGEKACAGVVATFGAIADNGYYDAVNHGEAVGMYMAALRTAEAFAARCGARFPAMAATIADARAAHAAKDAAVIAHVRDEEARMRAESSARHADMDAAMRKAAGDQATSVLKGAAAEQICSDFFQAFATGADRARSPKMYEFLERGGAPGARP